MMSFEHKKPIVDAKMTSYSPSNRKVKAKIASYWHTYPKI